MDFSVAMLNNTILNTILFDFLDQTDVAKKLIDRNVNISAKNNKLYTPLHIAVLFGNI